MPSGTLPRRVLVAEDDADHRFLTVRAIREVAGDVDVDTVEDGEQALDFLYRRHGFEDSARPDLILLDLRMPRVSGFDVLRTVKADDDLRTIPVVVLTSSDLPEDVSTAYSLGSNSYVTKPAGPEILERLRHVGDYWIGGTATLPSPPS